MNVTAIDLWVGKTLFLPPIIKICQLTRQSQYAISRLLWFIVALDQLRLADTLGQQVIAGLFSLVMMITASLRADMPAFSMMWFRLLALVLLVLDIGHGVRSGEWAGIETWLIILFAEYAVTIRTIPPADSARKVSKPVRSS
jgi:hypothetical protein